jgi:predicted AlkP superfamily phosphohydrolase/phosphomutase
MESHRKVAGNSRQKVVVLGIDGVPCTLLNRFDHDGVMPFLGKLIRQGTLCSMTASLPEVSSTSWSTFMTGVNPGKHGIYGFMELDKKSYSWKFPNTNDLKARTLWEIAGDSGKRSIVINIPSTYPARPLNGMLIAGFVALDLKKASYPDKMYQYLKGIGYKLDVDATKAVHATAAFTEDIMQTFKKRIEVIDYLYDTEEWDLFIAGITETDRLHHYLWDALDDNMHPQHEFFMQFYHELDKFIDSFYRRVGEETPFILVSDHGFSKIKNEIYLNSFLQQKGYLKFTKQKPESFAYIDSATKAFCLDPSRIYIHMKEKYARGCVNMSSYDEIRKALKEDLLSLTVNGEPVIRQVFLKEDIYHGQCFEEAPDMVVLPHEGYDLKGSIAKEGLTGKGPLTGGHTRENATFYINRRIACQNPNIVDAGVSVLKLLGIDIAGLDGTPLV